MHRDSDLDLTHILYIQYIYVLTGQLLWICGFVCKPQPGQEKVKAILSLAVCLWVKHSVYIDW